MNTSRAVRLLRVATCATTWVACAEGSDGAAIGGTVSGLNSGLALILRGSGANDLTVTANGRLPMPQTNTRAMLRSGVAKARTSG